MTLTIYVDALSQPCRAIMMFVRANNIQCEEKIINLVKGEHKTPEYLAINPKHQVPCIKDGDFVLSETSAILKYLAGTQGVADNWYPKDAQRQARVDEYLSWQPTELRAAGVGIFINTAFVAMSGKEVDQDLVKEKFAKMKQVLEVFEKFYLKDDAPYISGAEKMTIADLWAANELSQALSVGYNVEIDHPRVNQWYNKVKEQISCWDEIHKSVNEVAAAYKK